MRKLRSKDLFFLDSIAIVIQPCACVEVTASTQPSDFRIMLPSVWKKIPTLLVKNKGMILISVKNSIKNKTVQNFKCPKFLQYNKKLY